MTAANLSGTTSSTLTITSVSDADAGSYSVVVSDVYGSVTSSNAVLTVNDSLFIASQPQSQTVGVGSDVTFNVAVYGAPPFVFQWYFNGTPVGSPATGTNCSSCTLTNVGANQAGNYSVEVVNGYGSLTSSNANNGGKSAARHHHAASESHEQRGHDRDFFSRRLQLVATELSMANE